jgi:hypothetical protein
MARKNHSRLFCSLAAAAVGLAIFASVPLSEAASLDIGGDASNTGGNNNGAASASFSGDDGSSNTGTATFGNSPNRTGSTATIGSGSNGATQPDIGAVTAAGIAGAIGQLSIGEQQKLMKKCTSVLAAPKRYDNDLVSLCKVIASL